jgi:two-component system OmpR family response regulator
MIHPVGDEGSPIVLRWPAERLVAEQLAKRGVPRLLLVETESDPPVSVDPLEDWVRLPAQDRDVKAKSVALRQRAELWFPTSQAPVLDGNGRLLRGPKWVTLSPMEEQLAEVLLEHFGEVVGDEALLAQGWPDERPTFTALRVQLMRLRRRVSTLGLEIKTVRGRGYVLQAAPAPPAEADSHR